MVGRAACPETAGKGLIQKPAVCQQVQGLVRCLQMNRPQGVRPVLPDIIKGGPCSSSSFKAVGQFSGINGVFAQAKPEDDLALFP